MHTWTRLVTPAIWMGVDSGGAIGILVSSENTSITVMPFVLIVQLVMSGAIFELDGR